ncbi:MAG: MBL fold metallo-hydrolase [Acidobacteria bacterium]|nr:MBL fold metallo-hydrolase [Acidobacteriota bacterium]
MELKRLMCSCVGALALTGCVSVTLAAHSWQGPVTAGIFTLEKLTDQLYVLYGRGGNVAFYISGEGVLVIDDQYLKAAVDGRTVEIAQGIVDKIRSVTDKPIKFVVNTHYHGDHTGGNPVFVKISTIVAHKNVRKNLLANRELILKESPGTIAKLEADLAAARGARDEAKSEQLGSQLAAARSQLADAQAIDVRQTLPQVTYDGELQIYLGDEEIRVMHFGRAHTDGDSVIYFTKSGVAHWGDTFVNANHAFIDVRGGASTAEWLTFLDRGLSIVPAAAKMIPGHGKVGTVAEVRAFRQYLADLRTAVGEQITAGKSKEQAVAAVALPQYASYAGGAARLKTNLGTVYDEMKKP